MCRAPQRPLLARKGVSRDEVLRCVPDWARRPMNHILCDGRHARTARMGDYQCAVFQEMRERRKPMERTTRRQPSMPRHFGESIRRPGGSLPPPGPRLASLRSGVVVIPEKPKTGALTQRRLWATPLSFAELRLGRIRGAIARQSVLACSQRCVRGGRPWKRPPPQTPI